MSSRTPIDTRSWALLLVLSGAVFLEGADISMMGVALPSIRDELGMSTTSLQWVVSAYVLGYGGFVQEGWVLVLARFVTGLAAAFMTPVGLSIITTTFAEGTQRNRALLVYAGFGAERV